MMKRRTPPPESEGAKTQTPRLLKLHSTPGHVFLSAFQMRHLDLTLFQAMFSRCFISAHEYSCSPIDRCGKIRPPLLCDFLRHQLIKTKPSISLPKRLLTLHNQKSHLRTCEKCCKLRCPICCKRQTIFLSAKSALSRKVRRNRRTNTSQLQILRYPSRSRSAPLQSNYE